MSATIAEVAAAPVMLASGTNVTVSVSGGFSPWITFVDEPSAGVDRNYDNADQAMYEAKQTGRRKLIVTSAA